MTYHSVKKFGIKDGANATINADTATYHPCKILEHPPMVLKYSFNPQIIYDATGYNPSLISQGRMNGSIDIVGELRDLRQHFMLMGAVSNGGAGDNLTHTITTHTSRPNRTQTVYAEMKAADRCPPGML